MMFEDTIKKNATPIPQPRRSQIYVGFGCHQRCGFCYYRSRNNEPMFESEYVKRQIDLLADYGIKDIEITGGEPSECKHLRKYCTYIKERIPDGRIAIITNGGLFASDVWDLIDEVLVSYHAPRNLKNVSQEMFPLGSTYEKVLKTVEMAKSFGVLLRTNTVLGSFNYDAVEYILDDLIRFSPSIINFLPVNLFTDAKDMENFISYKTLRPIIKKAIDRLNMELPDTLVYVRYMPFCDMEGYEKHIVGTFQHIYDWFDWNQEMCGLRILHYLAKHKNNGDILKELGRFGSLTFDCATECRNNDYEKSEKCMGCKYYLICDGVEKTSSHRLFSDIIPSKGSYVKNIDYYLNHSSKELYDKLTKKV